MFPTRYFPDRYFAPRYWPKFGLDSVPNDVTAYVRVIVRAPMRRIIVPPDETVER